MKILFPFQVQCEELNALEEVRMDGNAASLAMVSYHFNRLPN